MVYPRLDCLQKILLALSLSAPSITCYAFNETDLFSDIPEIASATRISQDISEVPVSTTVITQELIQASGAIDIAELFKLVPGFQVYTPNANKYAVTYHGGSGEFPRNLDVRVNGRPVYIPLLSTVTWNTLGITLSDIQRIEVVRGSNVPSYGSNALMGAINIITKTPIDQTSQQITTTIGAQGRKNITTSFNGKTNDLYYRVSLGHEQNNGFDFQKDGENVNLGNLHLTFTPSLYDSIDLTAGFNNGTMVIGDGNELREFQDREHFSHFQYLQWNHVINDKHELNTQLYHNYLKLKTESFLASELLNDPGLSTLNSQLAFLASIMGNTYPFPSTQVTDFNVNSSAEHGRTETYGAEVQHTFSPASSFTLASGFGLRYEKASSIPLLGKDKAVDEEVYFIFSNAEWKQTEQLSWNAGFMSEFSSITNPSHSLRLASNYKLTNSLTLRGAITQAFRTPSLLEENGQSAYIFPEGVPYDYVSFSNDSLEAEKLNAAEVGLFWLFPKQSGFVDLKFFNERISHGLDSWFYEGPLDILSAKQKFEGSAINDEVRELRNTSNRTTRGVEVQASLKPTDTDLIHFAYSWNKISGTQRRGSYINKPDRLYDETAPRHTATLLLNHQFSPSLDASLIFNYMSEVVWLDSNVKESYKTTDIKISKSFPIDYDKQLTTSLLVKNMFDRQYSEFQTKNLYDRRLYLTMTLDF